MVQYAELVLGADTRGLLQAKRDLAGVREEGARTERGVTGSMGKVSKGFAGAGAAAAKFAAGAAAAAAATMSIGAAVGVIRQFEGSMSQVAAITGATGAELAALRDIAKELGSTTEFSAAQAADGLRFLGMAGFSAAESMKAIPAVLDLATAASIGLAESADIASNVLSGFGLEAGAAAEVADVLAAASSRANTSVSQLGSAMSTVAPISAALGIDIADTASAIGVLSDAGIQGERAGTALRGVLASLAGPTDAATDALSRYGLTAAQVNPESVALADIFEVLAERGLTTADAMTIFGREAASGALVLTEAAERVGSFGEELRNVEGAASDMAAIMRDNLAGSANEALSALEGLAVALGEAGLTAVLRAALTVVAEFARKLTDLVVAVGDFFTAHDPMKESVAAAAVAMNEEAKQALQVTQGLLEMKTVSIDVLGAKAALVEATLRQIEADQEAAIASAKLTEEYQDAARKAEQSRQVIDTLIEYATSYDAFTGKQNELTAEQAEDMERFAAQLREATAIQEQILAGAGELGPEYQQAVTNLEFLKALMLDVERGTINVSDAVNDVGGGLNFAQRVAQFLDGYVASVAGNADAAAGSVSSLNGVLASAAATAQALAGAMASAASQLGPLGSALSALGSGGILGRVTGGLGGVLGNIVNSDAIDAAGNRLAQLGTTMKVLFERSKAAAVAQDAFASSVGSAGSAAGGAAKKVDDFADEIERLEEAADPAKKFRREMEQLDTLLENGLSDGAYRQAVEDLNAEFVETSPILSSVNDAFGQMVDYMFSGFRDGMKGILNIFVNTLKQMAAMALKNRITIGLGLSATGGAAAAGVPGGGGILSGLFGGNGFLGLGGGAGSLFGGSGLLGLGGGSSIFGLGAGSGLATALGGGAFGAAASVALPVLGVGLALAGLFKKTEVLVAEGVQARIEGASLELDKYRKTKTNNGLGISSGFDREFTRLDDAVQSAVQTRLDATIDALEQFGFGVDLTGFSFSKRTEIKDGETFEGETEEVIREALDKVVTEFTDGALAIFQNAGESISETLDRMTNSLTLANDSLDFFGGTLLPISLDGAAAAAALTDLYGGLENFAASGQFLFENFTTTEQKLERATTDLNAAFEQLGVDVPKTHQAYLDLINSQDVMTERGRELHAGLSALAPLFTAVAGTADEAAAELAEYEAGLKESIRLRAEEKTAMLEANKALRDAQRATERREEIEARRAAQEVEFAKAQEAFADTVPLLAKQVSIGLLTIEQAAGGFGEEAVKQIEDAIGNMSALDLINARFNDRVFDAGPGNLPETGFEVFANEQEDIRQALRSIAANILEPFEGLAQRVGAGISGVNIEFGLNINQVKSTIASLESLGNARDGEIDALREVVDEYETTQRRLVEGAAEMSREIGRYLEMGVSEIVDALGDSAFEQATSSIGRLRDVVDALGGSAANAGLAIMELVTAGDAYGAVFDNRQLVVGAALENAEDRIASVIKEPFEESLKTLAPELEALVGDLITPILGIINEVDAGDVDSYSDAFVRLTDMFTSGQISVEGFHEAVGLLDDALDGFDENKIGVRGFQDTIEQLNAAIEAASFYEGYGRSSLGSDLFGVNSAIASISGQFDTLLKSFEATGGATAQTSEALNSFIERATAFQTALYSVGSAAGTPELQAEAESLLNVGNTLAGLINSFGTEIETLQNPVEGATDAVEGLSEAARELERLTEARDRLLAELNGTLREYELSQLLSDDARALQMEIWGLQDSLEAAATASANFDAAVGDLSSALDAESAALRQSVEDARNALAASLDAETQRLEGVLSGLQSQRDSLYDQLFPQEAAQNGLEIRDLLSDGLDLAKRLSEIARDVLGQNVEIAEQQREAAFRQLQGMLAAGAIDVDNVQDIARRASEFNSRQYATIEDMQFDQLVTANTITELSKLQEKLAQEAQAEEDARVAEARELAFDQIDLLDQQIAEQQNALARLDDIRDQNGIATDTLLSIAEAQVKFDQAKQYAETREAQLEAIRAEFGLLNGTLASGLSEIAAATGQAIQVARDAQAAVSAAKAAATVSTPPPALTPATNPTPATGGVASATQLVNEALALVAQSAPGSVARGAYLAAAREWERRGGVPDTPIPSYANGTDYHPGGWAKLHENEMVNLPRGTGVSTASEVREMAETNKRLAQQNEQNAAELRQIRRFLQSLADIEEDRRAEELAAGA